MLDWPSERLGVLSTGWSERAPRIARLRAAVLGGTGWLCYYSCEVGIGWTPFRLPPVDHRCRPASCCGGRSGRRHPTPSRLPHSAFCAAQGHAAVVLQKSPGGQLPGTAGTPLPRRITLVRAAWSRVASVQVPSDTRATPSATGHPVRSGDDHRTTEKIDDLRPHRRHAEIGRRQPERCQTWQVAAKPGR